MHKVTLINTHSHTHTNSPYYFKAILTSRFSMHKVTLINTYSHTHKQPLLLQTDPHQQFFNSQGHPNKQFTLTHTNSPNYFKPILTSHFSIQKVTLINTYSHTHKQPLQLQTDPHQPFLNAQGYLHKHLLSHTQTAPTTSKRSSPAVSQCTRSP